jgi:hypothetical protein
MKINLSLKFESFLDNFICFSYEKLLGLESWLDGRIYLRNVAEAENARHLKAPLKVVRPTAPKVSAKKS